MEKYHSIGFYMYKAKLRLLAHLQTWNFLSFLNLCHSSLKWILIFYLSFSNLNVSFDIIIIIDMNI